MKIEHIKLSHATKKINGTVQLTGSKSESNRALIIQALSHGIVNIENLSDAADTEIMTASLQLAQQNPKDTIKTIDIGPAGTAMRFLTSFLTLAEGKFILTGTERMQQRPIGILVEALSSLGANISYQNKEGYPPIKVEGGFQQIKSEVLVQGNISSQYISSLLLIASSLEKGLKINIQGELTSRPYVTMTLDMLKEAGVTHKWSENAIQIDAQNFKHTTIFVEPDWSAASYWYSIVALSDKGEILLPGLKEKSLQGDSAIIEIMSHFGVKSHFSKEGLHIKKTEAISDKTLFDFKECPDLAQTIVALTAALKRDISITGVETLKIKETDRLNALKIEIAKFGAELITEGDIYHVKTDKVYKPDTLTFDTYEDHRMAMAFAPLALIFNEVNINEPEVVNKSYPAFWDHLQQHGFQIEK
ncbi:3-phosphoshikimate 1-carboxyvinyltransferase [Sphingobacterium sp. UT-1RO-CII-1]|uniref:3-phosphoshikimate 1-carboxyvinyltransferase n=1 Tax=Sphingobacterium sp. UT-1RO-CII-1 TaxID=2995225 RepID=UPI00227ACAFA|nr:3-phosphoshikimate 1-carboxyvinyltransferase [Sphingobacterium sp. UT-1RO-CII-1]MCY4779527.1 3-phosphoshikimate 1-carboxyvinyltransferase [Sphingobacterium sp. UT-1RO-CII-1]